MIDPIEEGRDRLGELVQFAAGDAELAPESVERARGAVLAQFRQNQLRRRRRRRGWTLAALGVAAALVAALLLPVRLTAPTASAFASLQSTVGSVTLDGASADSLRAGHAIPIGARIVTGADGRLALRMPSGDALRVDVDSDLLLASATELELRRGALYVDSGDDSRRRSDSLSIRTAMGVARDIGTRFEVRVDGGSLRIRVRDGRVQLDGTRGSLEVEPGNELSVDAQGNVSRAALLPYGTAWDWLDGITPSIAIDGRPLRELLDWVARERGLRLEFADSGSEQAASRILLSGEIEGLSPDDALLAVLPTCRMTRSVESGILRIHSGSESSR